MLKRIKQRNSQVCCRKCFFSKLVVHQLLASAGHEQAAFNCFAAASLANVFIASTMLGCTESC